MLFVVIVIIVIIIVVIVVPVLGHYCIVFFAAIPCLCTASVTIANAADKDFVQNVRITVARCSKTARKKTINTKQ